VTQKDIRRLATYVDEIRARLDTVDFSNRAGATSPAWLLGTAQAALDYVSAELRVTLALAEARA